MTVSLLRVMQYPVLRGLEMVETDFTINTS